jgi:hypothetical protein
VDEFVAGAAPVSADDCRDADHEADDYGEYHRLFVYR